MLCRGCLRALPSTPALRRCSASRTHAGKPEVDWDEEFRRLKQRRPDLSGREGQRAAALCKLSACSC